MTMSMTRLLAALVVSLAISAGTAGAQDYPNRIIKLIMPFVPGSPVDAVGRVLMQHLQTRLGQNIVIENRPGAGTTTGAKAVATAPPDGYTLLFLGPNLAYYPVLFPNVDFDPKTLTPVATTVTWSHLYGVAAPVPARTIAELVAHAKANPGKLAFGYGLATMPHVIGEIFHRAAGLDILSVPYRGGEQARADLLGGRIHINVAPVPQMMPLIRDDKIRPLAYTGARRAPEAPDVPTMIESGYPQVGFHPDVWMAVFAPAGTPSAIVDKLNREINAMMQSAEIAPALKRFGYQAMTKTPAEFAAFHESELRRMPPILRSAGITAQ
jgi:tripartite-type tricarboxylate transporter receptor subunit TctC